MKPDSVMKQTGFFKSNKSRYPMYPCHEEKIKYDDYGEIIRYITLKFNAYMLDEWCLNNIR